MQSKNSIKQFFFHEIVLDIDLKTPFDMLIQL